MSYGSRVGNLNNALQSLSSKAALSEETQRQDLINKGRDAQTLFTEKMKDAEAISGDAIASGLGVKGLYNTAKQVIKVAKKVRDTAQNIKDQFQGQSPEEIETPNLDPEPSSISETSFMTPKATPVGSGYEEEPSSFQETMEDPDMEASTSTRAGDSLREAGFSEEDASGLFGGNGEDLDGLTSKLADGVSEGTDSLVASTGESVAADAGGEALAAIAGSQVLDAVPIVGEVTAAIGAIAGIGEGIAALVHHSSGPAPPAPINPSSFLVGSDVTSKYASLIPSLDTSVDRGGGSGVF
jgi:hypothetical protein